MAAATDDADAIRREMARIRHELHEDVRVVVANAEAATDWRRYLRKYPWVALGTAVAVGYLIVPRRRPPAPVGLVTQADLTKVQEAVQGAKEKVERPRKGLLAAAYGFVAPMAVRVAQGYAMQFLEQWLAQQQQPMPPVPQPPGSSQSARGPGRPGGDPFGS